MHYGINGWREVTNAPMSNAASETWEMTLELPLRASQLNYCFTDGTNWEHNSGRDWPLTFTNR